MPDMQQRGGIGKLVSNKTERAEFLPSSTQLLPYQKNRRAAEEIMVFFAEHQEARIVRASWLEDRRK